MRWDRKAASSADLYLTSSTAVKRRIRDAYGLEAQLVPPPHSLNPSGEQLTVADLAPGFFLCVARLLPYKNVDAVIRALELLPNLRLVIVGTGPDLARLRRIAASNVRFVGAINDGELRWLYSNCAGIVAASYEDYGLTPLEGAAFGKPAAVLRWGGFVDTVLEGTTGVFFDQPRPADIAGALGQLMSAGFDREAIRAHASLYSEDQFVRKMQDIAASLARITGAQTL
jgi:glycosyltransferase involved in cell wall biosynthesis